MKIHCIRNNDKKEKYYRGHDVEGTIVNVTFFNF